MSAPESFTIHPLSPAIGAEIRGLDIGQPLQPATMAALRQAWLDHIVLVFRGQTLDPAQQRAFVLNWGELGGRANRLPAKNPAMLDGPDYNAAAMLVSNIRENGKPIGVLPDGELWFHHDMCYAEEPNRASFLYSIKVPSTGGNTKFANLYAAWDNLPAHLKERCAGRRVLQAFDEIQDRRLDLSQYRMEDIKHFWHPMALRHPETGRVALYVNRLMSHEVEGLSHAEGEALLEELYNYTEDTALVYEHVWRPGDLLMWDNLCSIHARTDFPADQHRLMRRMTIKGTRPIPAWETQAAAQ